MYFKHILFKHITFRSKLILNLKLNIKYVYHIWDKLLNTFKLGFFWTDLHLKHFWITWNLTYFFLHIFCNSFMISWYISLISMWLFPHSVQVLRSNWHFHVRLILPRSWSRLTNKIRPLRCEFTEMDTLVCFRCLCFIWFWVLKEKLKWFSYFTSFLYHW